MFISRVVGTNRAPREPEPLEVLREYPSADMDGGAAIVQMPLGNVEFRQRRKPLAVDLHQPDVDAAVSIGCANGIWIERTLMLGDRIQKRWRNLVTRGGFVPALSPQW